MAPSMLHILSELPAAASDEDIKNAILTNYSDIRWRPNKYQHHGNQPKAQIIFKYSDQNMSEMLKTVRNFIDCMKANPATREHFKTNKLTTCKEYNNKINESDINVCNLDQAQQLVNKDKDIVFDALVAADYIDEVNCTNGPSH